MKNMRKKSVAVLAGLAVVGIVGASAASLGVLTSDSLGSGNVDVGSCDSDGVHVSFTTGLSGGAYAVSAVVLTGVAAACAGLDAEVTLLDDGGAVLGTQSGTAASGTTTVGGFSALAEDVYEVAVVISG